MSTFNEPTITYGVGRFVVDIPVPMTFAGGYNLRTCKVEEFDWDHDGSRQEVLSVWEARMAQIETIEPPKGKGTAIIETRDFSKPGFFCKGILFNREPLDPAYGYLNLLVQKGPVGMWIYTDGKLSAKDIVYDVATEVARAYRPPTRRLGRATVLKARDAFYLRYGAVDLPFEYEESVDVVFKGHPLDKNLTLSVETDVVDKVHGIGMLEGLAAVLAANLAPDVKIETIRTRKRRAAGLDGEEMILKGTEEGKTALNFQWHYPGKANDSRHPKMLLIMDADDSAEDEKIALWDAVLDSIRPAGR